MCAENMTPEKLRKRVAELREMQRGYDLIHGEGVIDKHPPMCTGCHRNTLLDYIDHLEAENADLRDTLHVERDVGVCYVDTVLGRELNPDACEICIRVIGGGGV